MEKETIILMPPGEKKKLAEDFNTSKVTVWKALNGKSNTTVTRMLRKAALERGGVESNTNYPKR